MAKRRGEPSMFRITIAALLCVLGSISSNAAEQKFLICRKPVTFYSDSGRPDVTDGKDHIWILKIAENWLSPDKINRRWPIASMPPSEIDVFDPGDEKLDDTKILLNRLNGSLMMTHSKGGHLKAKYDYTCRPAEPKF